MRDAPTLFNYAASRHSPQRIVLIFERNTLPPLVLMGECGDGNGGGGGGGVSEGREGYVGL